MTEPDSVAASRPGQGVYGAYRRRRWQFLFVFMVAALTIQAVGFFWPATYVARASVLITRLRNDSQVDRDPTNAPATMLQDVTDQEVNSEQWILASHEVLSAVVKATGLDRLTPPWYLRLLQTPIRAYDGMYARFHGTSLPTDTDRAIRNLGNALSVERLKESNVLVISYESGDPRLAESVLWEVLPRYMDRHIRVHNRSDHEPFFSDQVILLESQLLQYETGLQNLKKRLSVADVAAERDIALKLDATLREEESTLSRRLAELDATVASYRKQIDERPEWTTVTTSTSGSPPLENLTLEVLRLELEQSQLASHYKNDFPLVVNNREKLALARKALQEARDQLAHQSTSSMNPVLMEVSQKLAGVSAERAGVTARLSVLRGQLRASRDRLLLLDRQAGEATRVQRLIAATEERYRLYLGRREQARVEAALDQRRFSNVSVVQDPAASSRPERPRKSLVAIVSLLGSLMVAFLTCVYLEVSAFGLSNVLASIAPPQPGDLTRTRNAM